MYLQLTKEQLVGFAPAGCGLTVDDVLVDTMSCNYALKDQNPVDSVRPCLRSLLPYPVVVTDDTLRRACQSMSKPSYPCMHVCANGRHAYANMRAQVHFFTAGEPDKKIRISKEKVSNLIPDQFKELYIRVYLRDPEHPTKFEGARAAIRYVTWHAPSLCYCTSRMNACVSWCGE